MERGLAQLGDKEGDEEQGEEKDTGEAVGDCVDGSLVGWNPGDASGCRRDGQHGERGPAGWQPGGDEAAEYDAAEGRPVQPSDGECA
ncbi:hypothetical protein ACFV7R_25575 [Streptomyces sp. NPDC059866]|uniref:hypothetical protein n=1 Tax=Streptomyces sp. NPDC059866 TaxID=3346978 RepID=UPI00366840A4